MGANATINADLHDVVINNHESNDEADEAIEEMNWILQKFRPQLRKREGPFSPNFDRSLPTITSPSIDIYSSKVEFTVTQLRHEMHATALFIYV